MDLDKHRSGGSVCVYNTGKLLGKTGLYPRSHKEEGHEGGHRPPTSFADGLHRLGARPVFLSV